MNRNYVLTWLASCIAAADFVTSTSAQFPTADVRKSEPEYIMKARTAAPWLVVDKAMIVMEQENGEARTLQAGSNGFTCLMDTDGTPLCADANGMEWRKAVGGKTAPPDKTGFTYIMAGDTGPSNHDPYATDKGHRVQTGPHVMIVGAAAREMAGMYPRAMDPDPSQA